MGIAMKEAGIAQCGYIRAALLGQAAPLHEAENAVGNFDDGEAALFAIRRHRRLADCLPDAPMPQHFRI